MSHALQNKVWAEKAFDIIKTTADACRIFALLTIACNKVSAIDHKPTKIVKSLAFMMKLSGNNMELSKFYDGFVARCKARDVAGFSFGTAVLQAHMLSAKLVEVGGNTTNTTFSKL